MMPSSTPPRPPLLLLLAALPLALLLLLASPPAAAAFDVDARSRQEWSQLSRICPDLNYSSCDGVDRSSWTDAAACQFTDFNFRGLAEWSTFKLISHDFKGNRKTKGGDSWYIVLRDRQQRLKVPTRVFDDGDGTYTVAAYFLMPGDFTALAWIWYSDCNGLQQPSLNFREYDVGGKQPLVKRDHCYLGGRTKAPGFPVIDRNLPPPPCMQPGCAPKPAPASDAATGGSLIFRMETYYYRQNHTYLSSSCCKPRFPKPSFPVQRFLFYGDSTVKNSWEMLQYMARQLCMPMWKPRLLHEMFDPAVCPPVDDLAKVDPELDAVLRRCTGGAPWTTVPIGTNSYEVSRYHALSMLFNMSAFVYNDTYARNHVPPVPLPLPREFTFVYVDGWGCRGLDGWGVVKDLEGIRAGDVAVINIGAHCSRTMRFEDWQAYVDKLALHLKDIIAKTGTPIIWRTSFMMKEHVFRSYSHADGYVMPAHFNTEHRRLIFDSYAEHVLIPAGVHIWDVYGISAMGDYRPHDMVHSDGMTCWAMNTDMMDLFACHA